MNSKVKKRGPKLELAKLRQTAGKTQTDVARFMKISQAAVARFEKRSDWRISTLAQYIASLGYRLHLIAEMPNGKRIELSSFTML